VLWLPVLQLGELAMAVLPFANIGLIESHLASSVLLNVHLGIYVAPSNYKIPLEPVLDYAVRVRADCMLILICSRRSLRA